MEKNPERDMRREESWGRRNMKREIWRNMKR